MISSDFQTASKQNHKSWQSPIMSSPTWNEAVASPKSRAWCFWIKRRNLLGTFPDNVSTPWQWFWTGGDEPWCTPFGLLPAISNHSKSIFHSLPKCHEWKLSGKVVLRSKLPGKASNQTHTWVSCPAKRDINKKLFVAVISVSGTCFRNANAMPAWLHPNPSHQNASCPIWPPYGWEYRRHFRGEALTANLWILMAYDMWRPSPFSVFSILTSLGPGKSWLEFQNNHPIIPSDITPFMAIG